MDSKGKDRDTYIGMLRRGRQAGRQAGARRKTARPGRGLWWWVHGGLKAGNGGKGIGSWSTFN